MIFRRALACVAGGFVAARYSHILPSRANKVTSYAGYRAAVIHAQRRSSLIATLLILERFLNSSFHCRIFHCVVRLSLVDGLHVLF